MADQPELAPLIGRLRTAAEQFALLQPGVEAGAPWPLSENFGTEPEAHWGPLETVAHVAEMLPFWTGEIERVIAGPEPASFGRVASNPLRIGVLERDRTLPPRELFARIEASAERLARRLSELSQDEAARRGLHPTLGELTVAGIVESFVTGHLEDHVEQLSDALREG